MHDITIYQKPTCSTCRATMMLLKERGADFDAINYYIDPIPAATIKELLKKLGMTAIEIFRTKEEKFKTMKIAERNLSEAELIAILAENPELLQRPIVVRGERAVMARPAENVLMLFE